MNVNFWLKEATRTKIWILKEQVNYLLQNSFEHHLFLDIFQISGEHIRFSTVPLGIVCGKQDRSTVRECVFNAGNSLVDCKANAIFDFHTEDKPNPCRNTSLLIEYKEALPKHPGSCSKTSSFSRPIVRGGSAYIHWAHCSWGKFELCHIFRDDTRARKNFGEELRQIFNEGCCKKYFSTQSQWIIKRSTFRYHITHENFYQKESAPTFGSDMHVFSRVAHHRQFLVVILGHIWFLVLIKGHIWFVWFLNSHTRIIYHILEIIQGSYKKIQSL